MQFARFLIVGGGATLVQYLAFWAGMRVTDFSPTALSSGAYLIGSVFNYALNYTFTFASDVPHRRVVPKFYFMVFTGWLFNTGLMALMVDRLAWSPWGAQLVATLACLVLNFSMSRFFVFKKYK